jgi:hypothetical protein
MESLFWRDAKTGTRHACAPEQIGNAFFGAGDAAVCRGVRISHTTAVINGVDRALSKRLEREKARMN